MCDPRESMYLRIGPCPECDGDGEICTGTHYPGRWRLDPPEPIFSRCDACDGTGRDVIECEPVTLEDTTGVLLPVECFYKYPQFWPFEPLPETECRPCPVRDFPRQLDDWFASIFTAHPKLPRFQ